jgi:hypothetical protein
MTQPAIVGVDLGKNWFHLVGLDDAGAAVFLEVSLAMEGQTIHLSRLTLQPTASSPDCYQRQVAKWLGQHDLTQVLASDTLNRRWSGPTRT